MLRRQVEWTESLNLDMKNSNGDREYKNQTHEKKNTRKTVRMIGGAVNDQMRPAIQEIYQSWGVYTFFLHSAWRTRGYISRSTWGSMDLNDSFDVIKVHELR